MVDTLPFDNMDTLLSPVKVSGVNQTSRLGWSLQPHGEWMCLMGIPASGATPGVTGVTQEQGSC